MGKAHKWCGKPCRQYIYILYPLQKNWPILLQLAYNSCETLLHFNVQDCIILPSGGAIVHTKMSCDEFIMMHKLVICFPFYLIILFLYVFYKVQYYRVPFSFFSQWRKVECQGLLFWEPNPSELLLAVKKERREKKGFSYIRFILTLLLTKC